MQILYTTKKTYSKDNVNKKDLWSEPGNVRESKWATVSDGVVHRWSIWACKKGRGMNSRVNKDGIRWVIFANLPENTEDKRG